MHQKYFIRFTDARLPSRFAMKKNNLPESDLDEALRKAGVGDRNDVSLAVLETDGVITVIRKIPGPNILSSKT